MRLLFRCSWSCKRWILYNNNSWTQRVWLQSLPTENELFLFYSPERDPELRQPVLLTGPWLVHVRDTVRPVLYLGRNDSDQVVGKDGSLSFQPLSHSSMSIFPPDDTVVFYDLKTRVCETYLQCPLPEFLVKRVPDTPCVPEFCVYLCWDPPRVCHLSLPILTFPNARGIPSRVPHERWPVDT